ncbi:RNA polymerase sigma factor [Elongatibacter sediminis]|uniref:Sigma-70 family RNA polymerase sigma factor n=1 Tax=Elongatibacter sediminis TaxID=3119006 RepID=A0AAW9R5E8_9GAMM
MSNNRDHALIKRCLRGDRMALGELVTSYERPVFNVAYRILGNPDDAADITQIVFLRVFERLDQYNPKYKFFSWIYRIAINESINQRNRDRHEQPLEEERVAGGSHPEDALQNAQLSDVIQDGLMTLQEDYRTVVVLRHFSELSYRDIAEVLNIPEKTVKSRLYSARQLMKVQLREQGVVQR